MAEEVARRLDTINYEITCALDARGSRAAISRWRPALERAAREAAARRARAWLVGGAVRDRLLGRPVVDLDVAVAGDPRGAGAARRPSSRAGPCSSSSASSARGGSHAPGRAWQVDVTAAAGRLDRGRPRAARLHRQRDRRAARRRARSSTRSGARGPRARGACGWSSAEAFDRDPLRVLRLARFAAELRLRARAGDRWRPRAEARRRGSASRRPSACSPSCKPARRGAASARRARADGRARA